MPTLFVLYGVLRHLEGFVTKKMRRGGRRRRYRARAEIPGDDEGADGGDQEAERSLGRADVWAAP